MPNAVRDHRPKSFPPPQFPPHRPRLFARTPPAIFPALLGLIGLGLALRKAAQLTGVPAALIEAALGALVVLWVLGIVAIKVKVLRRFGSLMEDLATLPGRAGLAAATMSGMALAAVLIPYAPKIATLLALAALFAHGVLGVLVLVVTARQPPEARSLSPVWHLTLVGFILAAVPLAQLGWSGTARFLLYATMPVAAAIWALSARQLVTRIPPAPLRPLLAIHLAPAALFATSAALLGMSGLASFWAVVASGLLAALVVASRWILASGFSAMWGAMTFPLAAVVTAFLTLGGPWQTAGLALAVLATPAILVLGWKILSLWPGGKLAARTNAAEA